MNTPLSTTLLLLQLAATLFMTGVIWFVQLVHYPLFAAVQGDDFSSYARQHATRTTWVVAPAMVVEATTAALLLWFRPPGVPFSLAAAGLILVVLLWVSTTFVQVPCHEILGRGFDAAAHGRLVASNWLRTVLWSARAGLVVWMCWTDRRAHV